MTTYNEEIYYANLTKGCGWWVALYGETKILGFEMVNNKLYLSFKVIFNGKRNIMTKDEGIRLIEKYLSDHNIEPSPLSEVSEYINRIREPVK